MAGLAAECCKDIAQGTEGLVNAAGLPFPQVFHQRPVQALTGNTQLAEHTGSTHSAYSKPITYWNHTAHTAAFSAGLASSVQAAAAQPVHNSCHVQSACAVQVSSSVAGMCSQCAEHLLYRATAATAEGVSPSHMQMHDDAEAKRS